MYFEIETIVTKKNKQVSIRMINTNEAGALIDALVAIGETSPYVLVNVEEVKVKPVEDEIRWIESYNQDPRSLLLIAEYENKIIGILDFKTNKNPKIRHRGSLGISLHQTMRGEGLGELLFQKLLKEVKKIEGLTQIELSVMSENLQAFHLYRKVGFKEIGRKPRAYKQPDGKFCDEVMMVLPLQSNETKKS